MDGETAPTWRQDGREIFFLGGDFTSIMSAEVRTAPTLEAGVPKALFKVSLLSPRPAFWPSGDGQRFLVIERDPNAPPPQTVVMVNWAAGLF